jgi:hypothetical protein
MGTRPKRGPLYTPGFDMADIEFCDELPPMQRPVKKTTAVKTPAPKPPRKKKKKWGKGMVERHAVLMRAWKVEQKLRLLATLVAFDLLELRAENFEENEIKFRDQQQREAKAYAEKLAAAFRNAVRKEAAEKTAA